MYLFTRSDTIYGGTNQIQRNIIAERGLGMPKEAKGTDNFLAIITEVSTMDFVKTPNTFPVTVY